MTDRNTHSQHTAAVDRLVHHATIVEMNAESFRRRGASDNQKTYATAPATTSRENKTEEKACGERLVIMHPLFKCL